MKVTDIVKNRIDKLQYGYVFTYADFNTEVNNIDALMKTLNRLARKGKIRKLARGRFYKPKVTRFGELKPDAYQVVKDLLEKDNKLIGYITGYTAFNQLGITTQVPNTIQIGINKPKKPLQRGMYKIQFIKQENKITRENIPILRILDALQNIKSIPGTSAEEALGKLNKIIKDLNNKEIQELIKCSLNYKPSTRALTGAVIENIFDSEKARPLFKSLNPATNRYELNISDKVLPNKQKWKIK